MTRHERRFDRTPNSNYTYRIDYRCTCGAAPSFYPGSDPAEWNRAAAWAEGHAFNPDNRHIAVDRPIRDLCQVGTPECCIDHSTDLGPCESW